MIKKFPYEAIILGLRVSISDEERVLSALKEVMAQSGQTRPFFVVTAYSEFFLEAQSNPKFAKSVARADLVVADGVSMLAAAEYLDRRTSNVWKNLGWGWKVGRKIMAGEYPERVTGVGLTRKLAEEVGKRGGRVFLVGGWNGVAGRLAGKFQTANPKLQVGWDEDPDLEKINSFKPDVLLVALGRYKQEMWIAKNLGKLNAKVVMGVGSAFDELAGEGPWSKPVPEWVNRRGLKWLWRAIHDARHWPRVWRAVVVFPWRVFRS